MKGHCHGSRTRVKLVIYGTPAIILDRAQILNFVEKQMGIGLIQFYAFVLSYTLYHIKYLSQTYI